MGDPVVATALLSFCQKARGVRPQALCGALPVATGPGPASLFPTGSWSRAPGEGADAAPASPRSLAGHPARQRPPAPGAPRRAFPQWQGWRGSHRGRVSHIWKLSFPSEPCPGQCTGGDGREASRAFVPTEPAARFPGTSGGGAVSKGVCVRGEGGGLFRLRVCTCILGRLCICAPGG